KLVSPDEFSEENLEKNFADFHWIETRTRDHINVIARVMKKYTVIPFKFGTIFKNKESLEKFIADNSLSLSETFQTIRGKEEWSVQIYCDKKVLNEHIAEYSEEVRILERQILESPPGKAFLFNREKSVLIEREIGRLMKKNGQKCFDEYKNISEECRVNNLLPRQLTRRQDDMVLNASFFVDIGNRTGFIHIANLQEEKYRPAGFSFVVTGPWPPLNFVSVKSDGATDRENN
ncbi:MAG: GvpL/GvpF family gas vesicle protein, partial [Mangrovibacterium sp.]